MSFFLGHQTFKLNGTLQIFPSAWSLFIKEKFQLFKFIFPFEIFVFFLGVRLPVPRQCVSIM